jgi:hypothetical protein
MLRVVIRRHGRTTQPNGTRGHAARWRVADDEELADRMREPVGGDSDLTEKKGR